MANVTRRPRRLSWHAALVDGRAASYAVGGHGLPVLFLHGWGLGPRSYRSALLALMSRGCRVHAPALPGFAGTPDLKRGRRTMEGYAAWVSAFLDAVDLDQPVLVAGHSFGGGVAIRLADDDPDRVRQLVLINSVGSPPGAGGPILATPSHHPPPWRQRLAFGRDPLWCREGGRLIQAIGDDLVHNMVANPRALVEIGWLARRADLTAELGRLRRRQLPMLVLWSDRDEVLPLGSFDALCTAVGAEGTVLRGGHSWLLADPKALSKVVDNVVQIQLAEHEATTAGTNTAELRQLLGRTTIPSGVINQLLEAATPLWMISARPSVLAADLALCHPALADGEVRAVARPMDDAAFRLTVVARDRTGLLADTAGALAEEGLSVHSASVATWTDPAIALHALTAMPTTGTPPDWAALGERLRSVAIRQSARRRFTPAGKARVTVASGGPGRSVVKITAPDQVGLLEAITRWFADHGISILAAEITTVHRTATDRFVVEGEPDASQLAHHLSAPRPRFGCIRLPTLCRTVR